MSALILDKKRKLSGFELILSEKNLLVELSKVMYSEEFDDEGKHEEIMSRMPDWELYEKKRERGRDMRNEDIPPELVSLYGEVVMSREQEYHEFRKYNFLKYRALLLVRGNSDIGVVDQLRVVNYLEQAVEVKKFLVCSNMRLALSVAKNFAYRTGQVSRMWDLFGEAYYGIMRCITCFDFTLGNKFGTYATWGLRANLGRETGEHRGHQSRYVSGLESDDYDIGVEVDDDIGDNERRDMIKEIVDRCVSKLDKRNGKIIRRCLLDGDNPKLHQVGVEFGITKERVRQLKAGGLEKIRLMLEREGIRKVEKLLCGR